MKRLMMVIAIAVAANFAAFGVQPASAVDAHHPAQTTKGKKAKKPALKSKAQSTKSSRMPMMNCPMMKSGKSHKMMQDHKMMQGRKMMQGHKMMQGGKMMKGGKMKCPMMGAAEVHDMGIVQNTDPSAAV